MEIGKKRRFDGYQYGEKWQFDKNYINREQMDVTLDYYYTYPESFFVSNDFCQ